MTPALAFRPCGVAFESPDFEVLLWLEHLGTPKTTKPTGLDDVFAVWLGLGEAWVVWESLDWLSQ